MIMPANGLNEEEGRFSRPQPLMAQQAEVPFAGTQGAPIHQGFLQSSADLDGQRLIRSVWVALQLAVGLGRCAVIHRWLLSNHHRRANRIPLPRLIFACSSCRSTAATVSAVAGQALKTPAAPCRRQSGGVYLKPIAQPSQRLLAFDSGQGQVYLEAGAVYPAYSLPRRGKIAAVRGKGSYRAVRLSWTTAASRRQRSRKSSWSLFRSQGLRA